MKFPRLKTGVTKRLYIDALRGGCNLRDGARCTPDTQLCEAENVWWQNGALRTRPAFRAVDTAQQQLQDADVSFCFFGENIVYEQVNAKRFLRRAYDRANQTVSFAVGVFTDNGECVVRNSVDNLSADVQAFAIAYPYTETESVLLYFSDGSIYALDEQSGSCRDVSMAAYCPCVLKDGQGYRKPTYRWAMPPAVNFEGRNLLSDRFKAMYSTSSLDYLYFLPYQELDETQSVFVSLTDENGWVYEYTIEANQQYSEADERGVKACLDRDEGMLRFSYGETGGNLVMPDGLQNNLAIYASKKRTDAQKQLVASMRFSAWFGGTRQGGAACQFMAGASAKPNCMYWSAEGNPLYVSENSYIAIGDTNQSVTAFGKQDGKLIVFKERELYCMAEMSDVQKAGNTQDFPLTQIHGQIGTISPQTVQLCGNRLCWADGTGTVYTLIGGTGGYSVRPLSALVQPALSIYGREAWEAALATVFCGHYVLLVEKTAYVLRIDEKAFHRYETVYNDGAAQQQLAWFIWQLPFTQAPLFFGGSGYTAVLLTQSETTILPMVLQTNGTDTVLQDGQIQAVPITAKVCTKLYDMGDAAISKRITRLYLNMQSTQQTIVHVWYNMDQKIIAAPVIYTDVSSTVTLAPAALNVKRFGFTLEITGQAALDGVMAVYRCGRT